MGRADVRRRTGRWSRCWSSWRTGSAPSSPTARAPPPCTPRRPSCSRRRPGVCQDFAHLMIAALRLHGLPARYSSGYIETRPPAGREKLRGADASHAWVSAWVPGAGWVEVDPTNDQLVDDRYVLLGWGRDYDDVPPLRGVIFTEGSGSRPDRSSVDLVPGGREPLPSSGGPVARSRSSSGGHDEPAAVDDRPADRPPQRRGDAGDRRLHPRARDEVQLRGVLAAQLLGLRRLPASRGTTTARTRASPAATAPRGPRASAPVRTVIGAVVLERARSPRTSAARPSPGCGCGTSVGPTRAPAHRGPDQRAGRPARDSGTGDQSVRSTAAPGSGATQRARGRPGRCRRRRAGPRRSSSRRPGRATRRRPRAPGRTGRRSCGRRPGGLRVGAAERRRALERRAPRRAAAARATGSVTSTEHARGTARRSSAGRWPPPAPRHRARASTRRPGTRRAPARARPCPAGHDERRAGRRAPPGELDLRRLMAGGPYTAS